MAGLTLTRRKSQSAGTEVLLSTWPPRVRAGGFCFVGHDGGIPAVRVIIARDVKMHRPGRQAVPFFARNRFGHGAPQPVRCGKSRASVAAGVRGALQCA